MIHAVLICKLMKFYTPVDVNKQQILFQQVYDLINNRISEEQSSFLVTPPSILLKDNGASAEPDGTDIQIIYKNFATLYFVFIVDDQESELAILDLIQTFVECLDMCFANVCELDLVFGWQTLQSVLEEMVQGGMVIETDKYEIVKAIDLLNMANGNGNMGGPAGSNANTDGSYLTGSLANAFSMFTTGGFSTWGAGS
ncbi:related to AP-3 complex subunit sigma [Saccharomycodes ludwigii]|uniref:Related to AP-3 complex subunit sigma n=1 Tax=Saccharomycodes ludwigii TaxID=36035 RepID=A0A376B2H1_9ASCO|nr:related to AP-3 complex subunit sigma [Saccharomycodes ludwigii]